MGRYISREPHEPQLEDGETYDAEISKVEDENGVETKFGPKDRYVITYDVHGPNGVVQLKRRYNKSMFSKSNLYKLVSTVAGDEFEGVGYDVDDLVDKPCRVVIQHTTDDDTGTWDNIQSVLKPKKQSTFPRDEVAA